MDERLPYEQLIAEKLNSHPVPDMQDQIWARIKAQLDMDMPTDEGDSGGNSPQQPSGPGIMGWGLSIVIIAIITAFFIFKNKQQTKDTTDPVTTNEQTIQPAEQAEGPPGSIIRSREKATTVKPEPIIAVPHTAQDSSTVAQPNLSTAAPGIQDSVVLPRSEPVLTFTPPKTDTAQPPKKRKGVSGLTDDDYRIIPKKDN